jgi:hypothetical protein
MVDITEISAIIAATGVIIGVILTVLEIRHLHEQKQTDLLIRLYSWGTSPEFQEARRTINSLQFKDYEDYVQKYGSFVSETPVNNAISTVSGFYDLIGVLLYRKHVDLGMVYDIFGSRGVRILYEKLKPLFVGLRREFDEPYIYLGIDYLCNELLRKEPQLRRTMPRVSVPSVSNPNLSN